MVHIWSDAFRKCLLNLCSTFGRHDELFLYGRWYIKYAVRGDYTIFNIEMNCSARMFR